MHCALDLARDRAIQMSITTIKPGTLPFLCWMLQGRRPVCLSDRCVWHPATPDGGVGARGGRAEEEEGLGGEGGGG